MGHSDGHPRLQGSELAVGAVAGTIRQRGTISSDELHAHWSGRIGSEDLDLIADALKQIGLVKETSAGQLTWVNSRLR